MRVIIAPDKFKGTLTARQAAAAIARGWRRARPEDELELLPMSDGGDGFGHVMGGLLGAKERVVTTADAAGRPHRARWWWELRSRTAIIESAEVIGLAKLPAGEYHPFLLDTSGLGKMFAVAARSSPRRTIVGIGGSATNDGGFGLARSLGWRFLDGQGEEIDGWRHLARCRHVSPPARLGRRRLGRITVALDVQNPLLGPRGSTRVYGPQKGIRPTEFEEAEAALRTLATMMGRLHGKSLATVAGAGAAGGLGFGLMAFLGAQPTTGFSLFAREADLSQRLRDADLVITGEGALDRQSLMGKGVGELLNLCEQRSVPLLVLAGRAELTPRARARLAGCKAMSSLTDESAAMARPGFWLSRVSEDAGAQLDGKVLA